MDWEVSASGYAAVWATENTREAHLRRDEAQGNLRHHRPAHDRALLRRLGLRAQATRTTACPRPIGYAKGVPMGGDLSDAPAGKSPTFLVAALKDPIGANLDRIQIIKGWLDARTARRKSRSTTCVWGDARSDADGRTASSRRSATRWTWRTPPGPTPSALRN